MIGIVKDTVDVIEKLRKTPLAWLMVFAVSALLIWLTITYAHTADSGQFWWTATISIAFVVLLRCFHISAERPTFSWERLAVWFALVVAVSPLVTWLLLTAGSAAFWSIAGTLVTVLVAIAGLFALWMLGREPPWPWLRLLSGAALCVSIPLTAFVTASAATDVWAEKTLYCAASIPLTLRRADPAENAASIKDPCAKARTDITLTLTPIESHEISANEEVKAIVPFRYRRGSCSGRTTDVFSACLPTAQYLTGVTITDLGRRNGRFEQVPDYTPADNIIPLNNGTLTPSLDDKSRKVVSADDGANGTLPHFLIDPQQPQCVKIPWSVASGGRTGIGECRYHGWMDFNVELTGIGNVQKDTTLDGVSWPITLPLQFTGETRSHVFDYQYSLTDTETPSPIPAANTAKALLGWNYWIEVQHYEKSMFIDTLGWRDRIDVREVDVSKTPAKAQSHCLATELDTQTGKLGLTITC